MSVSNKMKGFVEQASWIRRMFEDGLELRAQYGEAHVYDFSLGNPNLEPPQSFFDAYQKIIMDKTPGIHGYMPNAGYTETREAVATYLAGEHKLPISAQEIIMTSGAGSGLNVVLKALLDPGDEVIVLVPYFVEYLFYIDNHGGVSKLVKTKEDFSIDVEEIENAISEKTKAIIINSPNNPTGRVYPFEVLSLLGDLFAEKSKRLKTTLYIISDEPYSKIVYDGTVVPSVFQAYRESIIVTSYSKELSIAGERIGYIAINPHATFARELEAACIFANRALGFVNAPATMQRVITRLQGTTVDIKRYQDKRDLLCEGLFRAGYEFEKPEGAFYVFPKSPVDDIEFVRLLQEKRILTVPGSGFGLPGYFRIAYCVSDDVIRQSLDGFSEVARKAKNLKASTES
ncbi:MAG: pyridoxal phosphate-dependent aminotransferase [Thermodesulfobacteriota bacterium]|nr:pyridoxal phosphate-dependent aminotransferase [Thermodesulfobacteriota bacterium]